MASDTLEKTDEGWQRFQGGLDGLTDEQLVEPETMGEWSIKDVMAHLAFWDSETVSLIDLYTGAISRDEDSESEHWQQINERVHHERAGWSLDRARSEMTAAHAAVRTRLQEALAPDTPSPTSSSKATFGSTTTTTPPTCSRIGSKSRSRFEVVCLSTARCCFCVPDSWNLRN